jgi:drug/metabolite transporter (DMT)-like permease
MQVSSQAPMSRAGLVGSLILCSTMWSSGYLFMKLAAGASVWVMASSRAVIAVACIVAVFLALGRDPRPRSHEIVPWLVLGTFNGWLPNIMTAEALTMISAGLGSMIQAIGPIMVALMAHFALPDERLTLRRIAGVLLGFAGMGVLVGPAAWSEPAGSLIGIGLMLLVSLSYAFGNIYARALRDIPAVRMALGQQAVSALASTLVMVTFVGRPAVGQLAEHAPALIGLGLIATAVPITIFMTLIQRAGTTQAAMIGYLIPVWATILAVIFLGETVGLREIVGALIILAGVWIVTNAPPSAPRAVAS